LTAVVALVAAVGVGYAVAGHPIALAWSAGVALVLLGPEILYWIMKPRRARKASRWTLASPWIYLAVIGAGLVALAGLVLAWRADSTVGRFSPQPVRSSVVGVFWSAIMIGCGLSLIGIGLVAWYRDLRRTRTEKRTQLSGREDRLPEG